MMRSRLILVIPACCGSKSVLAPKSSRLSALLWRARLAGGGLVPSDRRDGRVTPRSAVETLDWTPLAGPRHHGTTQASVCRPRRPCRARRLAGSRAPGVLDDARDQDDRLRRTRNLGSRPPKSSGSDEPLERDRAAATQAEEDVAPAARVGPCRAHARAPRRRAPLGAAQRRRATSRALGAMTGGQAVQMVKAGLRAIYLSGWQVAADANLAARRTRTRASIRRTACRRSCGGSTTRCCAPTRSTSPRAGTASTGSRRSSPTPRPGFGGAAQRVRADEGDDRGGRRGRALRGPARVGEEVRPPRRQGARPDEPVRPHARGGAARGRRPRRSDGARRAHRRAQRDAADERRRPGRRGVPDRRANARGLLPRPRRARAGDRALARLRAVRRRALVRDLDARTWARRASSRTRSTSASRASCSRTTARRRSTGSAAPRRRRRSRASRTSSASSATASSSSRSPASTR